MTTVRSLLFNILFALWTALIFVLSLPTLVLPRGAAWWMGGLWVRGALLLLRALVGLGHRVRGAEHRIAGPAIYAAKHQSAWDTLVFPLLLDKPAYVLKQELIRVPLFGSYLKQCGMIPVDRQGGGSALKRLLKAARAAVAEGRSILIYPEGTRTPPGERRPYHPGVAALYGDLGIPVVPVALNSGLFWGRRSFNKRPGTITIEFLPAIPPGLPRREFMQELQDRMEGASERLRAVDTH
ncbi:MAG TPA: 1-acyl-sn-glycerol-3-phosphate acyltransferase, partial [Candidatus Acidoferrum sp.]|jgi:1-acyl-sn-glycerol-3-phosphate acyltransferase|nr:1-acyl-sn-glycerol-3-phosphate acyltransferase [Candidatus Acidoferrum sp.]